MKKSRLSYDEWDKVILSKKQTIKLMNNELFHGFIGEIDLLEVPEPQIWRFNGEDIVVCQNGYRWLSILPMNEDYCITAMMNEENHILLWYIDMIAEKGVDKDGIPFFYDLYLDLVVYPDGSIMEDDRDELEEALERNDITSKQFELANETCDKLKRGLLSSVNELREYTLMCQKILHGET